MGDQAAVGTGTVLRLRKLVDVAGVPVPIPNPLAFRDRHAAARRMLGQRAA